MTAEEWDTTDEFRRALGALFGPSPGRAAGRTGPGAGLARGPRARAAPEPPSERKLFLLVAALGRTLWYRSLRGTPALHFEWADRCERFADGRATDADRATVRPPDGQSAGHLIEYLPYFVAALHGPNGLLDHLRQLAAAFGPNLPVVRTVVDDYLPERSADGCAVLRDLFGNPFRPLVLALSDRLTAPRSRQSPRPGADGEWRTDTAVAIAKGMYESRDFGAMPILADALQDAGCDNEEVLAHCRGPGPHARGCWVVDLVLGKS